MKKSGRKTELGKEKSNLSAHAKFDRGNRLEYIAQKIYDDKAEVFCVRHRKDDPTKEEFLYTNGALVIRNTETHKIITAFMCDAERAVNTYSKAKGCPMRLPDAMYHRIEKNHKLAQAVGF